MIITPEQVKEARKKSGLTALQAAELVYSDKVSWFRWEGDKRKMSPALFELFFLKTGQHEKFKLVEKKVEKI